MEGSEDISFFTDEFHYPVSFLPEDVVIDYSFQPFLFQVWSWLPHMPRDCEGTLRGIVRCRAGSTTTALIAVREVKPFEVGRERAMFREEENIFSNPISGIKTNFEGNHGTYYIPRVTQFGF
ncbi:hypothetical protein AVEN_220046-1 [Araneus ventricosus]|uniref:Uncharacterized protein n=1 Tax=Araneus ventricosus TaxID=182803 RepID=A0A4Y2CQ96_ARAVE|nr:hypothetical protein AVEN_220046-1 [Araneus ventricosus]